MGVSKRIHQCIPSSGALLGGEVYVYSIRCTTFELTSFWICQRLVFLTRVNFFISGCFGCPCDGDDQCLSTKADCMLLASTLYNRATVGAVGHSWDSSKDLCVCTGIHLDAIKPGGRKRIIIYSLIVTY